MDAQWRVGIGYDIHRLVPNRALILGGVKLESDVGLSGHSDGDVVLHAVTDALLGAAAQPDIGELFPDTDPAYEGIDSAKLLVGALERVREAGYEPCNVDVIVHAERPKLSRYKVTMAASIADILGLPATAVSVKAKTAEGLGPIGAGEAIACTASVSIVKQ